LPYVFARLQVREVKLLRSENIFTLCCFLCSFTGGWLQQELRRQAVGGNTPTARSDLFPVGFLCEEGGGSSDRSSTVSQVRDPGRLGS
jgi:hypothetical protein